MPLSKQTNTYSLLDSGKGAKLERFGPYVFSRPAAQAVWNPSLSEDTWKKADAILTREKEAQWNFRNQESQKPWQIQVAGITFKLSPTDFGHLGIFPEQKEFWEWIQKTLIQAQTKRSTPLQVLNLFAYSGGSTFAAAKAGAHVCHLDASKGMVAWARENAVLNDLDKAPIRWIVDDVNKFVRREIKRGKQYDAIILDPPSFGRGAQGELFKIEEHLPGLLEDCRQLLSPQPLFLLLSCHTPGFSPIVLQNMMEQLFKEQQGTIDSGEMCLRGEEGVFPLPNGTYSRWIRES